MKRISEIYSDLIPKLYERSATPEMRILCLPKLNFYMHGLPKGEMIVVGARSSQGKSAFATQLCVDLVKQEKKILFMSLEMGLESITERMICNAMRINNMDLLKGKGKQYAERLEGFKKITALWDLVITDEIGRGWKEISKLLESLKKLPDVVVLDYVQNIKNNGMTKDAIDDYLINFRSMCMKHNICGIILSQINRASQDSRDKRPHLHQLKATGNLEEAADKVLLLNYPYKTDPANNGVNDFEINLAKNRNGMTGIIRCKYEPEFYRFSEIEESKQYVPKRNVRKDTDGA